MFSLPKLIVLLIICETTVCQSEYSSTRAKFRRETQSKNNKSDVDAIIPQIFTLSSSDGLVLFNTTHVPIEHIKASAREPPQPDQPFNEKQDFKKSSNQRSSVNAEKGARPKIQHEYPEKDFFFPDEIDPEPKCQEQGKSFCTDVQNYPEDKVENMLKNQLPRFDVLFGNDDLPQPLNISQRMSPGEDSLCKSVERLIYPKAGESKDLKWLYIVNQQNYTQAVKIEECVNPDAACMFADSFPNGYVTSCKQSYTYRQLVAFTKSGEIVKDSFKLPSCCKCIYKQR